MARQMVELVVDDLTGDPIPAGEGESIDFTFNGITYHLDLTKANAADFREAISPYLKAATRVPVSGKKTAGTPRRTGRTSNTKAAGQFDNQAVRQWAREAGYQVSDRGRVPAAVLEAYRQAWATDDIGH